MGFQRLPESEWPELFTELKIQDKLELELKKKRVEGKDSTGDLEASTRDKMLRKEPQTINTSIPVTANV